jgi:outer membrane protein assembly factor BamB
MVTKFGWMETMDAFLWLNCKPIIMNSNDVIPGIVPLVLIPLTTLTVALTSLAGIIAGWFGIKLHTEGPKQFLEVLLKKRILISMLLFNLVTFGLYKTYTYVKTLPSFISTITKESDKNAVASRENYPNELFRNHQYEGAIFQSEKKQVELIKEIILPKGVFRSGAISGESIFYGNDDGNIYEINKNDLSMKRKFFIGTEVTTRPIIYENRIYAGEGTHYTHHARIYAFNLVTGKFINSFQTKGHTEGQPIISSFNGKTLLFITAGADGLYAVDPINMTEVWHQTDGHIDGSVSIENGIVYAGTGVEKGSIQDYRYAIAYDFLTGKIKWKKELPMSSWMHPIVTRENVCYVLGEIYFPSSTGLLQCLNKIDGGPVFSIPSDGPIASKPFYIREQLTELIFFGNQKDEVCSVDINMRKKVWCTKVGLPSTTHSFASIDYDSKHNLLWYPSSENGIFALDPKQGKIINHWLPKNGPWNTNYSALNVDGDSLIHLDGVGKLRKFKIN